MQSPKQNTKMTGDTHLAEIESDFPIEEGSPIGLGTRGMQSGLVGHAVKKAGVITDGKEPFAPAVPALDADSVAATRGPLSSPRPQAAADGQRPESRPAEPDAWLNG